MIYKNKISFTKSRIIKNPKGKIIKFLNKEDFCNRRFGEFYFSFIKKKTIKAWKFNQIMTSHFLVPCGRVCIVIFNKNIELVLKINLSDKNLNRVTVPPGYFYGFKGLGEKNIIASATDQIHRFDQKFKFKKNYIKFDWSLIE